VGEMTAGKAASDNSKTIVSSLSCSSAPEASAAAITGREPSSQSPLFLSVDELLRVYRQRILSPVEVTREALDRIVRYDDVLNAFLHVTADEALAQARRSERAYRRGNVSGPLEGVPLALKDTFPLRGTPTTYGSLLMRDNVAARDCTVVAALRRAGAVFVGKTNTPEFGQSATTENLLRDPCRNPWDTTRTSGGSSGGTAAAVAAGLASVGIGSDGGGSIRIPAAFCGLFGIKPTVGLVRNRGGARAMTDFSCPGPLTRSVDDARRLLEVLTGNNYRRSDLRRLRVAFSPRPEGRPVDEGVAQAVAAAVERTPVLASKVEEVEPPIDGWVDIFSVLVLADERRYRGHLLEESPERLTRYELRTLEEALKISAGDVARVRAMLRAFRARFVAFFARYDLLVTPTIAVPAFPVGTRPRVVAGQPVDGLWGAFPFTAPYNVSGCPAATIPVGLVGGLPVAVQLVAAPGRERLLLDVAEAIEEVVGLDGTALSERYPREQPAPAR
jgi:Asp-tRNA(Asn)/Glu-tRNA(Gln) amidotransferase A subunit family amidase